MKCVYCGENAEWVPNEVIYGRRYGRSYMIWLCRKCDAYVGCHNNTRKALGKLANETLRKNRVAAHAVFDPLWKSGRMSRSVAYTRISEILGHRFHIGEADEKQCKEIIGAVATYLQFTTSK